MSKTDIDEELKKAQEMLVKVREGVCVNGKPLAYLANFAKAYLEEYKKLAATLSEDNQDKLGFGNNKYIITIRYGTMNNHTVITYTPTTKRTSPEYIIVDEANIQGPNNTMFPAPSPPAVFWVRDPSGSRGMLLGSTDEVHFSSEQAKKDAQDIFTMGVKEFIK